MILLYYNEDPDIQIEKFNIAYFHDKQCINKVVVINNKAELQGSICINMNENHSYLNFD